MRERREERGEEEEREGKGETGHTNASFVSGAAVGISQGLCSAKT